jgi:hypothetical protein
MIYITHYYNTEFRHIKNLWQLESETDVKDLYSKFLISESLNQGIIINPHWYNLINHKDHHPNLTVSEYKKQDKYWRRYLKDHSLDWYIEQKLNGVKLKFKEL